MTVTCRDGREERGTHVVSALPLSVLQDGVGVACCLCSDHRGSIECVTTRESLRSLWKAITSFRLPCPHKIPLPMVAFQGPSMNELLLSRLPHLFLPSPDAFLPEAILFCYSRCLYRRSPCPSPSHPCEPRVWLGSGRGVLTSASRGKGIGIPAYGALYRGEGHTEVRSTCASTAAARVHLLRELHSGILVQVRKGSNAKYPDIECEQRIPTALRVICSAWRLSLRILGVFRTARSLLALLRMH